jgi:hypothetical protein
LADGQACAQKKIRYQLWADNGFFVFMGIFRPLSTLILAAVKDTDREGNNKANKVVNGNHGLHVFSSKKVQILYQSIIMLSSLFIFLSFDGRVCLIFFISAA